MTPIATQHLERRAHRSGPPVIGTVLICSTFAAIGAAVAARGGTMSHCDDMMTHSRRDQPRISDLRNDRLQRFSLDQLVRLLARADGVVELRITSPNRCRWIFKSAEPISA